MPPNRHPSGRHTFSGDSCLHAGLSPAESPETRAGHRTSAAAATRHTGPAWTSCGMRCAPRGPLRPSPEKTTLPVTVMAWVGKGAAEMHARVSTFQSPADKLAKSEQILQTEIAPKVLEMNGSRGIISLVDRESGKSLAITLWDSEDAMHASEEPANQVRAKAASASGGETISVERYDVSIFEVTGG
jgi:hypothetical protein